ncbi:MAG: ABC transporter permease [Candidatus Limiplasma sp.]|nr:ABC transporter permease [Candidatus Limiplasma sp.]
MKKLLKVRKIALVALIYLCIVLVCAVFAEFIATYDPNETHGRDRLSFFSNIYLLGTDNYGRDIFSRLIYGTRMSLLGSLGIVAFSVVFGVILGVVAGYVKPAQAVLMRIIDVLMAFPPLLLAMVLVTILGSGVFNVIVALGTYYMTRMTRIIYSMTLKTKEEVYIEALRSEGAGTLRIIFRHIVPNLISPIIVQATFTFSAALLQMASLDFLGLGIPTQYPTWGNMLSEGSRFMTRAPWLVILPGLVIVFTVLSINVMGDLLRDNIDPRFRDIVKS